MPQVPSVLLLSRPKGRSHATSDLRVAIEDAHIVVSIPGTSFRFSFFKFDDDPRLVQSTAMSAEKEAPSDKRRAFEALAWEVADAKARELGWIV